jgi:TPR repeat protein
MLEMASAQGYARASYALGLVLRDSRFDEASKYMRMAADAGYLPALHELLPAREMKEKYGEPSADELRCHLDHLCLNRLLSRHYIRSPDLRNLSTSHCWNPLCGRWAFKASVPVHGVVAHVHLHRHHDSAHANEGAVRDQTNASTEGGAVSQGTHTHSEMRVSRMKMCSRCSRAKYCSKLCQVYDWRSGRHKMECQFL